MFWVLRTVDEEGNGMGRLVDRKTLLEYLRGQPENRLAQTLVVDTETGEAKETVVEQVGDGAPEVRESSDDNE